jgi:hypothetical protein
MQAYKQKLDNNNDLKLKLDKILNNSIAQLKKN